MDNIESLFDKAVGEIERMLDTKTVVGEPMTFDGNTLIPLISVGFGFGVGAGEGTEPQKGTGHGGGTGGGGGVKPVALVVINESGVYPTNNFQKAYMPTADKASGEVLADC